MIFGGEKVALRDHFKVKGTKKIDKKPVSKRRLSH
jgi:hypothetical protein